MWALCFENNKLKGNLLGVLPALPVMKWLHQTFP